MTEIVWTGCPARLEIEAYVSGGLDADPERRAEVEAHLEACADCVLAAETIEAWLEEGRLAPMEAGWLPAREAVGEQAEAVAAGQVWSVRGRVGSADGRRLHVCRTPPLVLVLSDPRGPDPGPCTRLDVVPLAPETEEAADDDVLMGPQPHVAVRAELMAQVWNRSPALRGHLGRCLGRIDAPALEAVRALARAVEAGASPPDVVRTRCGPTLGGPADPRRRYRRAEAARAAHLRGPVEGRAGEVVVLRFPRRAVSADALPLAAAGGDAWSGPEQLVGRVGSVGRFDVELCAGRAGVALRLRAVTGEPPQAHRMCLRVDGKPAGAPEVDPVTGSLRWTLGPLSEAADHTVSLRLDDGGREWTRSFRLS